ncbi:MAG TPA: hydroxysqualene dehydroxylase HpnE [Gaiellaceae bacterium]|nr:hydroxysqualene dehydroxylase HpnE [Gaiellaceae bacterium]
MTRVVVVGGGLAGVTAALECADRGASVTLLEARARLGGATFSVQKEGLWLDNGQHVFLRCCTAYRALLRRLGVEDDVVLQPRLDIPVLAPGGRRARLRRDGLPAPLHLARALARYRHLSASDRARLVPAALALRRLRLDDPALDGETFAAWLERRGQSRAAVDALWDLITLPTVNLPAREASLALATKVFQTGLLERADASDVGYARVPLQRLHGDAAERALRAAGATVRLKARASAIAAGTAGPTVTWAGGTLAADAVVLAVPHDDAAELLPEGALEPGVDPTALGASPIVNLHVVYDRPVTDLPFAAGVGTPVQWVFDRTASAGLERGQCLAVSLSGADAYLGRSVEELRGLFVPALAALFPAAARAEVQSFFVTREPRATFRGTPRSARHRPGPVTRVPGLVLAGAWTDTGWPATMEGAVRSGVRAAEAALGAPTVRTHLAA